MFRSKRRNQQNGAGGPSGRGCGGRATAIDKGLRIFGNTDRLAPTVLDGNGAAGVLFVNERVTVTLTRLAITGGNATLRVGGGI